LFARAVSGNWLTHSPDAADKVLRALPMAYTLGRGFNFSYFCSGCTSVLMPSLYGPEEYLETVERHGITHANANPTVLRWLVDHAPDAGRMLAGLKVLGCTGATLSPELKRELLERVTPNLFEKYGAVTTGVMTVARPEDVLRRPASVGRPEYGVTLEIVDDADKLVPIGTIGSLRCKSLQAADPLDEEDEGTSQARRRAGYWYTDDRGRVDEEGYLYLAGRRSNLIIRASVNIYAEELEEVIRTHPQVSDVAVLGRASAEVGEEPVALVVVREPSEFSEKELIAYCRQRLSGNKRPAEVFVVKELPRALAGKIKRGALPALLRLLTQKKVSDDRKSERDIA
jgi:acyl-CoA synthetase (AMP-forming)/AMP-acid ligase II